MPTVSYTRNLSEVLADLRARALFIPRHQRDFCWTPPQMKGLVDTVKEGLPMPAILIRKHDDRSESLEDGRQRMESIQRYVDGIYPGNDGRLFAELSEVERDRFMSYPVVVVCYSGVGDVAARRIFNYCQGGRPLTVGERLWSLILMAPIVEFANRTLLTRAAPGEPPTLGDRLAPMLGEHDARSARAKHLTTATALCGSLEFGINYLSRKWDDLEAIVHRDVDAPRLLRRLETYVRIWERVHALSPVTRAERRKKYWDLGNYGGYMAYSILLMATPEGRAENNLPETEDELVEAWARHIVAEYEADSPDRVPLLHRDLNRARSWKLARWQNGLRLLFVAAEAVPEEPEEELDEGEETEEEDTE